MQLEDYFIFLATNDIRLKNTRIGIGRFFEKNLPHPSPPLAKEREQDFRSSPFARGN